MGKGQLLTRLWVRALCYLHLIKICLQLRLLLEEESLLLESVFLQLLFKAPRWFFTIEWTGVLGFRQKAGLLEPVLEVLGFQALPLGQLRMHTAGERRDAFLLLRNFLLRATTSKVLELRSS